MTAETRVFTEIRCDGCLSSHYTGTEYTIRAGADVLSDARHWLRHGGWVFINGQDLCNLCARQQVAS